MSEPVLVNLTPLDLTTRYTLTVPFIASCLIKGLKQVEIARMVDKTRQAVNDYIKHHADELVPLIDDTDGVLALKAKHIANRALDRINLHLDETTKKDLFPLNAISGTHLEKYRLLANKSTENIGISFTKINLETVKD